MKDELIRRRDVLSCLHLDYKDVVYIDKRETAKLINAIKAVDTVSVVRGKWIDRSDGGRILYPWYEFYECNKCGQYGTRVWRYCPNCGAKMDGEREDE